MLNWIAIVCLFVSIQAIAIDDPNNLMPKINAYIQQDFHQAFSSEMTYDYNSVTCQESHCDKFHMIMKITPQRSDRIIIDMLDENGKSFGARPLSRGEWDFKGKSVFHLSLHQQISKYPEVRIDSMRDVRISKSVNGSSIQIDAKEIAVFLRSGSEVTNKVFTITNQLPGYAAVLKIHDKQQKPIFKNIDRQIDHIFY